MFLLHSVKGFFAFVGLISLLVSIHELAHYWVAKKIGVKSKVVACGFGPELFGYTDKAGTRWSFRLFPLGGYVQFVEGSNPTSLGSDPEKVGNNNSLAETKPWKRILVLAAGPISNILLSLVIMTGLFYSSGYYYVDAVIGDIVPSSAAEDYGLKVNDKILTINNNDIVSFQDIKRQISGNENTTVNFVVLRDGKKVNIDVKPSCRVVDTIYGIKQKVAYLGVLSKSSSLSYMEFGFFSAIQESLKFARYTIEKTGENLKRIILGEKTFSGFVGPVKIAKISSSTISLGWEAYLQLIALFSLSVGIINLLPIPLLDGGYIFLTSIEWLLGRKLSDRAETIIAIIGVVFLFIVSSLILIEDIASLFGVVPKC